MNTLGFRYSIHLYTATEMDLDLPSKILEIPETSVLSLEVTSGKSYNINQNLDLNIESNILTLETCT